MKTPSAEALKVRLSGYEQKIGAPQAPARSAKRLPLAISNENRGLSAACAKAASVTIVDDMHSPLFLARCQVVLATLFLTFTLFLKSASADLSEVQNTITNLKNSIQEVKLDNGITLIIYPKKGAPIFSGVVAVRVGGTDEQSGESGIAHMLEHMAFKGTKEIGTLDYAKELPLLQELETLSAKNPDYKQLEDRDQKRWLEIHEQLKKLWVTDGFTREYEKRGAVGMNATTDSELTRYFVSLPRNSFEFWCYTESERLINPVLRQFYQERDVVMEERRMRYDNDPSGKLYELMLSTAFTSHPYRNPVIGYPFDIDRLTASKLASFFKKYYVPEDIVIALVGDIDPATDIPMIKKYFGRLERGAAPSRPHAIEPEQQGEKRVILKDRGEPQVLIAYHKPTFPDPVDVASSVLFRYLAETPLSPLYVDLVRDSRKASSIDYNEAPGYTAANLGMFEIVPAGNVSNEELVKAFDAAVAKALIKFDPDLIETSKRSLAVEYLGLAETDIHLGLTLASNHLLFGNWRSTFDWFNQVLSVDETQLRAAAAKILRPENRTVGFLERQ